MSHVSSPRLSRRTAWLGLAGLVAVVAALSTPTSSVAVDSSVTARFVTSRGWVKPDETYTFSVRYVATDAATATLTVTLPASAYFVSSAPSPSASTAHSATYTGLAGQAGEIVIDARAASTTEDPEVVWKNISATAQLVADATTLDSKTNGPWVTELESAILGDRPFPVVNVQYGDLGHCTGAGTPVPECTRDHPVSELDAVLNSKDPARTSIWQHFTDMSLGKLNVQGTAAALGKTTVPFSGIGQHKFSQISPSGACTGTTRSAPGADGEGTGGADGTPVYMNRIENGWYVLPGTQGYYGADKYGHGLGGAVTGVGAVFGIDDACGPTGKMAYDAASLADPDIDYNEFDSDRDGLVDFFEILFAGVGGNGSTDPSGVNNVWPHSSSLEFYFTDVNGEKGYVSNDQRRDAQQRPLWWTTAGRVSVTTTDMGAALKAYVRVGRYNVNPETAFDKSSVISHEYGHSLGLPDFYSLGTRSTFGTWELMAEDHSQYMTGYTRQKLGWVVPRLLVDGQVTLRESKYDTHSIVWRRPDGTEYELSGADVHNADLYKVRMPNPPLIDAVPDGVRAFHSGAGNDFGCPADKGHGLLIALPDMKDHGDATAAALKFKTKYEIEWDYDYGFVLVSTNGGQSWTSLASKNGTTIAAPHPANQNGCFTTWNNGITGVSGDPNIEANPNRASGTYVEPQWVDDEYDLTAYKGQELLILLSYETDPGLAKKGWFVDQLSVTLTKPSGDVTLYATSFETDTRAVDDLRLGALGLAGWNPLSTADGGTADHAYYVELRDRISWDFDGRGQDDRANGPSWQPGVSMVYTNEATGYGNTDGVNPPHQTPVDAAPQPGNESPVLDDAAFTLTRPEFNGCTHVDNYVDPDAADENWKLPDSLKFTVTDITGLSSDGSIPGTPATATLLVDIFPDCSIVNEPPVLSVGSDYTNPDPDGLFTLSWTRPAGASGPDTLQQATVYSVLLEDDAEGGLTQWVTTTSGSGAFAWEASPTKSRSGNAFWGRTANGADVAASGNKPATMLTTANAIAVPTEGSTTLSYWDFYMNEGDDTSVLEASADDGATWKVLSSASRSELAPDAAPIIATEPLAYKEFSLDEFKGQGVKIQFRMQAGGDDRAGSSPFGWYVDDIRIETNNFADVMTIPGMSSVLARPSGSYFYRVRTAYPAGPVTVPSGWSNVEQVVVAPGVTITPGNNVVPSRSSNNRLGGALPPATLLLLGLLALGRRRVRVNVGG